MAKKPEKKWCLHCEHIFYVKDSTTSTMKHKGEVYTMYHCPICSAVEYDWWPCDQRLAVGYNPAYGLKNKKEEKEKRKCIKV